MSCLKAVSSGSHMIFSWVAAKLISLRFVETKGAQQRHVITFLIFSFLNSLIAEQQLSAIDPRWLRPAHMLSIVFDIDWYPIYVCVCLSEQIRNSVSRAGFFREIYHFRGQTTEKKSNYCSKQLWKHHTVQIYYLSFNISGNTDLQRLSQRTCYRLCSLSISAYLCLIKFCVLLAKFRPLSRQIAFQRSITSSGSHDSVSQSSFIYCTNTHSRTEAYMRENENKNKIDVVYAMMMRCCRSRSRRHCRSFEIDLSNY